MKSFKYIMMLMIFGASAYMDASQPTAKATAAGATTIYNKSKYMDASQPTAKATAAGATTIYNKSNMPIVVAYNTHADYSGTIYWSASIPAGQTGTLTFKADDVISQVTIFYNGTSGNPATDGQIRFFPSIIDGASLVVYGNSAFTPGTIDTTVAATPVPARFAAWWTGNIPVATDTTAALAIADANVTPLVTLHVANPTATNDFGLTGATAAF